MTQSMHSNLPFHLHYILRASTDMNKKIYSDNYRRYGYFTVNLFSLYSRLVNNREIKLTLIIQRQLQYYSISAAIVKIKYAK